MKVRLGFSIAIHLEPDILLIDEVLAVGDISFRVKCLEKMNEFKKKGVTIIFVSHSMGTVQNFCDAGILLHHGQVSYKGDIVNAIDRYIYKKRGVDIETDGARWGHRKGAIKKILVVNENGEESQFFKTGDPLKIIIGFDLSEEMKNPVMGISITDEKNNKIYGLNTSQADNDVPLKTGGEVVFSFPSFAVGEGTYFISVALHDKEPHIVYDWHDKVKSVTVINLKKFGGIFDLSCKITSSGRAG